MIIGITGTLAAGKGIVSEILMKKGFNHFSVRNFLIKEIIKRDLPVNRTSMVVVANDLREKFSSSYIVEELFKETQKIGGNCIIESIRAVGEAEALKKKEDFILIAVDADIKIRYERITSRQNETDKISYGEFISNENREMFSENPAKQSISKVMEMANFKIINNGTIEEVEKDIEKILEISKKKNNQFVIEKRKDYISWDDYFMGIAILSGKRSKDPSTQVGACIVNRENKIVGVGYNGFPTGCSDENLPWARKGEFLETKYPYVCHGELNAILNSPTTSLQNCRMYVGLFPCNECAKAIIQSGIKKIIYLSDKYANTDMTKASKKMFDLAGIEYKQIIPKVKNINIEFF